MDSHRWLTETDPFTLLGAVRDLPVSRKLRLFCLVLADRAVRLPAGEEEWQRFRPFVLAHAEDEGTLQVRAAFERQRQTTFENLDYPWSGFLEIHDTSFIRDDHGPEWLDHYAGWDQIIHCSELLPDDPDFGDYGPSDNSPWDSASNACRVVIELAVRKAARRHMLDNGLEMADEDGQLEFDERMESAVRADAEVHPRADLCALLREVFGNPFAPLAFDPVWRTETVLNLARGVYEDGAFERLPILADALQEAGCELPELLGHCRNPGEHVRGCWALDLVLGKS